MSDRIRFLSIVSEFYHKNKFCKFLLTNSQILGIQATMYRQSEVMHSLDRNTIQSLIYNTSEQGFWIIQPEDSFQQTVLWMNPWTHAGITGTVMLKITLCHSVTRADIIQSRMIFSAGSLLKSGNGV